MKFYGIESKWTYQGTEYRFFSLYNGMRGAWTVERKEAIKEGEFHKELLLFIHNNK